MEDVSIELSSEEPLQVLYSGAQRAVAGAVRTFPSLSLLLGFGQRQALAVQ